MSEEFPIKPEFNDKSIRSFVIRAGRMTDGQRKAFDLAWKEFGMSLFDGEINPEQVFGRQAPLVVEVGFGMGDSLLEMCKNEPEKNFIGIEVHPPGVGRLINNAYKEKITNLKVYMADANDVLTECIPNLSVDRLQVFFPDPWHKKKHNKRRIIQPTFITTTLTKIKSNGCYHFATDWQEYAEHMIEVLNQEPKIVNTASDGDYCPRPDHRPITKFERRGERLGHGVWDIIFRKSESE